ncbi:MAG: tRNA lysidine(34) synthetase TilS [Bacteroidales bacterium]|jgi:tRNA(Ile)-lysidine synthase|nr:tRNA lysidine(34) synthetase TilS [Bacteroidales bacterium]
MDSHSLISLAKQTISDYSLCNQNEDSLLIGVSGGVDSIVLCHVLYSLGYSIAIAHCNFQLRNAESDADEQFVRAFAKEHSIPVFVHTENTHEYAEKKAISIEMAAREIRYNWFNTLCDAESFSKIAIAHNANDSIETFFINLFRTTGIKGLTGIPIKNDRIIRPLSFASRNEIETYARENSLRYRTDSTNSQNIFLRNKIRNQLLPLCREIAPHSFESMQQTISHIGKAEEIYRDTIVKEIKKITSVVNNTQVIDKELLHNHKYSETLLFEILHPYGFNPDIIQQLFFSLQSEQNIGKIFSSNKYKAIVDRDFIFIEENINQKSFSIQIFESDIVEKKQIKTPYGTFIFNKCTIENFSLNTAPNHASFDKDTLTFPLTLRTWNYGDSFRPFGMKGKMKISDFLINEKIPVHAKQNILVLESDTKIIWVCGLRISEDTKITSSTKNVLCIDI